ncbi:HMA domain-containing protein [Psidium guajava]|nr:HMA domain-containing protein [Psidium guajava]
MVTRVPAAELRWLACCLDGFNRVRRHWEPETIPISNGSENLESGTDSTPMGTGPDH